METTQHTPADVRERVKEAWATVEAAALAQANVLDSHYGGQSAKAAEIRNAVEQVAALLRAGRGGRSALWWAANELVAALEGRSTLTVQQCITGVKRLLAEADLRTPRGEGEDTIPVSALRSEIAQLKAHGLLPYLAWARLCALAGGVPVGEDTPAALRSEAQGDEADALDLIRWAEARAAVLEPVVGNLTPPGTYACYVEGVGDDPAEYEDAGEPYMGPGILGAIRAARRGEAPGDGPVGAVCANCGAPNAAIAGGELDPDEAVCSVECYDQLMELGCPQAHGGDYRPRPARTNGGNDATT